MASPTQWTWVWASSGIWWWTGRPCMLQSMGSQKVGHDWATELNWTEYSISNCSLVILKEIIRPHNLFSFVTNPKLSFLPVCYKHIWEYWILVSARYIKLLLLDQEEVRNIPLIEDLIARPIMGTRWIKILNPQEYFWYEGKKYYVFINTVKLMILYFSEPKSQHIQSKIQNPRSGINMLWVFPIPFMYIKNRKST